MWRAKAAMSADAQQPRARTCAGGSARASVAEALAVVVDLVRAQVHLEVADHVDEHEAHQHDAGDRHDPLLADRRSVELERPPPALRRRPVDERRRRGARGPAASSPSISDATPSGADQRELPDTSCGCRASLHQITCSISQAGAYTFAPAEPELLSSRQPSRRCWCDPIPSHRRDDLDRRRDTRLLRRHRRLGRGAIPVVRATHHGVLGRAVPYRQGRQRTVHRVRSSCGDQRARAGGRRAARPMPNSRRTTPTGDTVMDADFLQASLYTSVVAFGVAALVSFLGVMFVLVGFTLHELGRERHAATSRHCGRDWTRSPSWSRPSGDACRSVDLGRDDGGLVRIRRVHRTVEDELQRQRPSRRDDVCSVPTRTHVVRAHVTAERHSCRRRSTRAEP